VLSFNAEQPIRDALGQGEATLVIEADSADIIASVIYLKAEVETKLGYKLKITISGAAEAHLLAPDLSQAGVGVILRPSRPFPTNWEKRRM
jgi:hypothetical protein